jgi:hypothetical protein
MFISAGLCPLIFLRLFERSIHSRAPSSQTVIPRTLRATMSPYKQKEIREIAVAAVEALAYKESKATKYGLLFHRKDSNSPLTIKEIRTTGIFHSSNLESGMHVLEINGVESIWLSPVEGGRLLRHADVGTQLSIKAARPRTIKATKGPKESKDSKWGFAVKNSTTQRGLFIESIAENSPFADTDLRIGNKIIQINGRPCPQQVREAAKMLKASAAKMEITAVQQDAFEARDEMDEICREDNNVNRTEDLDMDDYCYESDEKPSTEQRGKSYQVVSKDREATKAVANNKHQIINKNKDEKLKSVASEKSMTIGRSSNTKIGRPKATISGSKTQALKSERRQRKWSLFKSKKKVIPEVTEEEWVDLDEEELTVCSTQENVWFQELFPIFAPSPIDPSALQVMQVKKVAKPVLGAIKVVVVPPTEKGTLVSDLDEEEMTLVEENSLFENMFPWFTPTSKDKKRRQKKAHISSKKPIPKVESKKVERRSTRKKKELHVNPKSIQEKKPDVKNMGKKESKNQIKKQSKKKVDPKELRPVRRLSVFERSRLSVAARSKNDESKRSTVRAIHEDNSSNALVLIQKWQENICRAIFSCPVNTTKQEEKVEQKETRSPRRILSVDHTQKRNRNTRKKRRQ